MTDEHDPQTSDRPAGESTPTRRRAFRWIAVLVLPVLTLALVEIAFRLVATAPPTGDGRGVPDELTDPRIYAPDDDLIWTLRPSARIDVPDGPHRGVFTNSLGFRGGEVPEAKEPGELRVLCLGDSVTYGLGLANDATIPARLQSALAARPELSGRKVTVLNAGVPGYSAVQGLRAYERLARFAPDAIVFWFGINDAKPAMGVPDVELRPADAGTRALGEWLSALRTYTVVAEALATAPDPDAKRVSPEQFRDALARIVATARVPVVAVRYPEQLDTTIAQLADVIDVAETARAGRVRAPWVLLFPYAPTPVPSDRDHQGVAGPDGRPRVVFGGARADTEQSLDEVRASLALVRDWKTALDERLAELPADAVTETDLLGALPEARAFTDNCHFTAEGAAQAAEALAGIVVERLRAAGRLDR